MLTGGTLFSTNGRTSHFCDNTFGNCMPFTNIIYNIHSLNLNIVNISKEIFQYFFIFFLIYVDNP